MTPQEITDYRRNWMVNHGGYGCGVHTDIRRDYLTWLKENSSNERYSIARYTDVYEDTIYFEDIEELKKFYAWYQKRFTKAKPLDIIEFEMIKTLREAI